MKVKLRETVGWPDLKVADWMPVVTELLGLEEPVKRGHVFYRLAIDTCYNEQRRQRIAA